MTTLSPGQSLTTPGRTIGAGDINLFAGLVGDFTPIHVDEVFAKASPLGRGLRTGRWRWRRPSACSPRPASLGERVIALLNLNWDFSGPVKIDDTIRSRVTLAEQRPTSKPGREVATFLFEVINQDDQVVQRGRMLVLVRADYNRQIQNGSVTMGDFMIRPEDEAMHKPDASVNFNESVYTNGFNTNSPVGGWMRLGNRVNEGYAELSVCLYLPDGRIACQFQRPSISNNERFDAGGLSYSVIEPLKKVSMTIRWRADDRDRPERACAIRRRCSPTAPRRPGHVQLDARGVTRRCMAASRQRRGADHVSAAISRAGISTSTRACTARSGSATKPSRSTAMAGAIIPGARATGRRFTAIGCSSPISQTATGLCC